MPRPLACFLCAALLAPTPAAAQRLALPLPSSPAPALLARAPVPAGPPSRPDTNRDAIRLVMGGLGLGVVGVFVGGYAGAKIEENGGCAGDDLCGLAGAFVGATVGETLLLPAGVHLANDARGNYALALGAASLVGVTSWVVTIATNNGIFLLAIPVGQLIAAALVELHTGATPRAP